LGENPRDTLYSDRELSQKEFSHFNENKFFSFFFSIWRENLAKIFFSRLKQKKSKIFVMKNQLFNSHNFFKDFQNNFFEIL